MYFLMNLYEITQNNIMLKIENFKLFLQNFGTSINLLFL